MSTISIEGNGRRYPFKLVQHQHEVPTLPGTYALLRIDDHGRVTVLYFGKANDLQRRIFVDDHEDDGHHRARSMGANGVGIFVTGVLFTPEEVEAELIRLHNPPANIQVPDLWPPGSLLRGLVGL